MNCCGDHRQHPAVPGASVTHEQGFLPTLVLNVIFLAGLLVFAVLLGMVGGDHHSFSETETAHMRRAA